MRKENELLINKKHSQMEKDIGFSTPVVDAISNYILEHGFGEQTPSLDASLTPESFRQHYYEKKELVAFCRLLGIPSFGLKNELNERIYQFLRTGKVAIESSTRRTKTADSEHRLELDQQVVNYRSDAATRAFFEHHIPVFTGFSALVQKQIKERIAEGQCFTYADALDMHRTYLREKKDNKLKGKATSVAHDSCQYNQFAIDYSHDGSPKIHSLTDAWMLVRKSAGEKTYQRYKDKINEIRTLVS